MSDEIISSESEATVNNQNPSTPPSSPSPIHPCERDHTHRLHNRIITTNNAKRVKVGSERRESETEGGTNIKLNLWQGFAVFWNIWTVVCWAIDAFVGLWVMTNLVTRLVAKQEWTLHHLDVCILVPSEPQSPLVLHLVDISTISRQPFRVIFLSKVEVRRSGEAWWTFHMLSKHYGWLVWDGFLVISTLNPLSH